MAIRHNPAVAPVPFALWTLRDEAAAPVTLNFWPISDARRERHQIFLVAASLDVFLWSATFGVWCSWSIAKGMALIEQRTR